MGTQSNKRGNPLSMCTGIKNLISHHTRHKEVTQVLCRVLEAWCVCVQESSNSGFHEGQYGRHFTQNLIDLHLEDVIVNTKRCHTAGMKQKHLAHSSCPCVRTKLYTALHHLKLPGF